MNSELLTLTLGFKTLKRNTVFLPLVQSRITPTFCLAATISHPTWKTGCLCQATLMSYGTWPSHGGILCSVWIIESVWMWIMGKEKREWERSVWWCIWSWQGDIYWSNQRGWFNQKDKITIIKKYRNKVFRGEHENKSNRINSPRETDAGKYLTATS